MTGCGGKLSTHRFAYKNEKRVLAAVAYFRGVGAKRRGAPLRPEVGVTEFSDNWVGGFFCPCHGSTFDLSGRVFAGVPASDNLVVPPHSFEDENILVVGVDAEAA